MKNIIQKIFLLIGILILIFVGIEVWNAFHMQHTYYDWMRADMNNWKMIFGALVASAIPVAYLIWSKKFSLKYLFFLFLPVGLLVFAIIHIAIKDTIFLSGFLPLIVNNLLLYALSIYFIVGSMSLGDWISSKLLKFKQTRRQEMMINFGIGLGAILLLVYVLILTKLLFGLLIWIVFIGLGFMIYYQRKSLEKYKDIIVNLFREFSYTSLQKNRRKRIGIALIVFSLIYYFYGFQLSFIPYSTAWDANHAYMYLPKVWAANNGTFWTNGPGGFPNIRLSFITFWFSLAGALGKGMWLAPETFAVNLNFISGIFVLIFGVGLSKQVIDFFVSKSKKNSLSEEKNILKGEQTNQVSLYIGRFLILLWVSSGMGAFLVFVDNKTDMGVLSLTILALLSGFIFLDYIRNHEKENFKDIHTHKESLKYVVSSGFLFALASMAKQTAFIDILVFGLLLVALWFGNIIGLGVGIVALGAMGILKPLFAFHFINPVMGKYLMLIGFVIIIIGVLFVILKNKKNLIGFLNIKKKLLTYILIWTLALVGTLVIFKGPYLVVRQYLDGNFGVGNFTKGLLMGKNNLLHDVRNDSIKPHVLLATNENVENLGGNSDLSSFYSKLGELKCSQDEREVLEKKQKIANRQIDIVETTFQDCKVKSYTDEELEKYLVEPTGDGGMEDIGRYVGFGRREFQSPSVWSATEKDQYGSIRLGYRFLKIFYPSNGCYGANSLAKDLCNNSSAVDNFDLKTLVNIFEKYPESDNGGYQTLCEALTVAKYKNLNGSESGLNLEMRDQVVALRQYYQSHSVKVVNNSISVPFRYLVPLNVVFNRSLQNLSSYYTDIGFIRLFAFIFVIMSLIYSLIKKDKNLTSLIVTTMIGRAVWRAIGGGIVRYGMGLIVRTVLVVAIFFKRLFEHSEDEKDDVMLYIFLGIFVLRGLFQITLNFVRISSQGASGPFSRYKMNIGKKTEIDNNLQYKEFIGKYTAKDVFDLQFPHYNKFIEATADKDDKAAITIEGTYLTYFVKNQNGMSPAGFDLAKMSSDSDTCKTYKRFEKYNMKYIVTDPNIGTVVMGEGNESLFHRFFAKIDPVTGKIKEHGKITMLTKMYLDGYLKLFGTSNLGAKYAFSMSDNELRAYFGNVSDDELLLIRAKLNVARFFQADVQKLVGFVGQKLSERFANGQAIGDIADVYGKIIQDENKLILIAKKVLAKQFTQDLQTQIGELSNDEKIVLSQYIGLENMRRSGNPQFQEYVNSLIQQSLAGSSQLIILEMN